jgi:hypothetical protein
MTDYNDGRWHGWNGEKCPVPPKSIVQLRWLDKEKGYGKDIEADYFPDVCWEHVAGANHIVAFRVTKPYVESGEVKMTTDIFNITTPFGLLDEETQKALKEWQGKWSRYYADGWLETCNPGWVDQTVYKAIPLPATKPSINWDHVSKKWQWLAKDENGRTYLHDNKPSLSRALLSWHTKDYNAQLNATHFSSFSPGDCDWKDSLVQRPAKDMSELL